MKMLTQSSAGDSNVTGLNWTCFVNPRALT